MLVVSHEMNFIKNFCSRVIFMSDGKIQEQGTSKEIFDNPKNEKLKNFLSKVKER
jgi:ABC-type histidine transport system ATPase subunit